MICWVTARAQLSVARGSEGAFWYLGFRGLGFRVKGLGV